MSPRIAERAVWNSTGEIRVREEAIEKSIRESIKEYTLRDSTVWLLYLREMSRADLENMYACCSMERQKKAESLRSEVKRRQSVGAGYLLFLLKKHFSIEEEPVICSGGKPVFPGNSEVYFNLSHSGDYAALAFGRKPLGVDIECVKRANLKVAKRFFQKEEYEYLAEREGAEQADAFFRIWTAKEAVVKAAGGGLCVPLDSFCVLEERLKCCGNVYELCRKKLTEHDRTLWISVAQTIAQAG